MLRFIATKFLSKENLRVFALWALQLLEEQLDTEAKPRLEKYRRDRAALEAQTQIALSEIASREARLKQLAFQRSALEQTIAQRERDIQASKEEIRRIDEESSQAVILSDDDALHTDLSGRSADTK